jgi:hypothetical protein
MKSFSILLLIMKVQMRPDIYDVNALENMRKIFPSLIKERIAVVITFNDLLPYKNWSKT